jgi:nucleoside phosphorylase
VSDLLALAPCGRRFVAASLAFLAFATAAATTAGSEEKPMPKRVAVLSAFPAELAPLVARAKVEETVTVDGRPFRVGTLEGVPVVLALTGIGMVNATNSTRTVLERFDVRGVVVSGVAGSTRRIGDVDVPVAWALKDGGGEWPADPEWLAIARRLAAPGAVKLESCTRIASGPSDEQVCLSHEPEISVGGVGKSGDSFGEKALPCTPNGDEVSGCDVAPESAATRPKADPRTMKPIATDWNETVDMETAAIAREAAAKGLPYIAFRAGSDGAGDPLELPGFPAQFFAYYRLAAQNAAAATTAFLKQLGIAGAQ